MPPIASWSAKHWLLILGLGLAEAAVLIPLLLIKPSIAEGVGSWLLWVIVIVVNVVIIRRFVAFGDGT